MSDIRAAFDRLTPGAAWRNTELSGDPATDYDRIIWQDEQQQKPTLAACQQAMLDYLNNEAKQGLREEIIALSEKERAKYISNVPGKVFEYIKKSDEVFRYDSGARDAPSLPIMTATSIMLSIPLDTIAGQWRQKVADWGVIGGAISAKYDALMLQLEAANFQSMEEIEAFRASIDFSL